MKARVEATRKSPAGSRPATPKAPGKPASRATTPVGATRKSPAGRRPATSKPRSKSASVRRAKVFRGPALRHQAEEVLARLRVAYPDARTELNFTDPFQLLVVTILSAQTTDVRVNMVSPALFARYPGPEALAAADPAELEGIIRSTGFFHAKAKSLIGMAKALVERYGGVVPASMEALVTLAGVGRKTANVVLGNAFGLNEGVVVDTHVARLSARLGLTSDTDPIKIEETLMTCVPQADWTLFSHLLIFHGRRVCSARSPAHDRCVLADICPSAFKI